MPAVIRLLGWLGPALALTVAGCGGEASGPNRFPIAEAGPDLMVFAGQSVQLDGSASYDPEGEELEFHWDLAAAPRGSAARPVPQKAVKSELTTDLAGVYVVALTVVDPGRALGRDVVVVRATSVCQNDLDCDDGDQCTQDRCLEQECVNTPVPDCVDNCPDDPEKLDPGQCGCGVADTDADSDGTADCVDGCPNDPGKVEAGACGCGVAEDDADGDSTPDCVDGCPNDPKKIDPGTCGCGIAEDDPDGDGFCRAEDCAPMNPAVHPGAVETCNGLDDDCNGLADEISCPCTLESYGDHLYQFCALAADWDTARSACRSCGYTLVTINDAAENAWLWGRLPALTGSTSAWHGFNDVAVEGRWVWDSGSGSAYTNWYGGQPDNFNNEDCGQWWQDYGSQWNDRPCAEHFAYVCESDCGNGPDSDGDGWPDSCDCAPLNPLARPGAEEICNGLDDDCDGTADALAGCPCYAADYSGHRYLLCSEAVDWATARQRCADYGYQLAALDDAAENAWLLGAVLEFLGGNGVWHGYNDLASEGSWVWDNGSAATHTNWNAGEPNNNGDEDCAYMFSSGLWNDVNCATTLAFVCETVPCPSDPYTDIDGDGICGDLDTCPVTYNPDQAAPCPDKSCLDILDNGRPRGDGLYWISPPGLNLPLRVYCDMNTLVGGWTLVAVYGTDGRPAAWGGNAYPRPGASFYGRPGRRIFDPAANDSGISNYSIDAADLWEASNREVLAYVGGTTDDFIHTTLPAGCNYFDGDTWCAEDAFGPFTVYNSNDSVLTTNAFACTTAHRQGGFAGDFYDEFGLHLLDGSEIDPGLHCSYTGSTLGHQAIGRLFTSFECSDGQYWNIGIHSHWNPSGIHNIPGALLIR